MRPCADLVMSWYLSTCSLFTNIPITGKLALEIAVDRLRSDEHLHERTKLDISDISMLLEFCLNACDFSFNGNYYHQKFGCPMGSPISMIVANLVMQHLETKILSSSQYDVLYWRRFADDTWVVLPDHQVSEFLKYINSLDPNIKFTVETEDENNSLTFLDVRIERTKDFSFQTPYFSKASNTDRLLNFSSNHPLAHKKSVINSLITRIDRLTVNESAYHNHIANAVKVLSGNGYPLSIIKNTLSRNNYDKNNTGDLTCKRLTLPYVSRVSEKISNILYKFGVKVCHKPIRKVSSFLPVRDKIDKSKTCGVVYRINCKDCMRSYVGQTRNSLATRVGQHRAALRLMQPEKSALAEHALSEGHQIDWSSADILSIENNAHRRLFVEALHTTKTNQPINRCELFIPSLYKSIL